MKIIKKQKVIKRICDIGRSYSISNVTPSCISFINEKEVKRLKHVKTIILGIICAILLVACESSSKPKRRKS